MSRRKPGGLDKLFVHFFKNRVEILEFLVLGNVLQGLLLSVKESDALHQVEVAFGAVNRRKHEKDDVHQASVHRLESEAVDRAGKHSDDAIDEATVLGVRDGKSLADAGRPDGLTLLHGLLGLLRRVLGEATLLHQELEQLFDSGLLVASRKVTNDSVGGKRFD